MTEFARVVDLQTLESLDGAEMFAGYRAGAQGLPEPLGSQFSRSYWHGWRNGAADAGHIEIDEAMRHLAHLFNEAGGASYHQ